ncbi:uncharacterized protein WM277_020189 isoform 1-T2 [Molossus nigricans]
MEPKTLPSSDPDLHPLSVEFCDINTDLCEEGIIYAELKMDDSSNIQKNKISRNFKIKESPWCLAAFAFAFLYLIVLVVAAIMIAKVNYLEGILQKQESEQNETAHCKTL